MPVMSELRNLTRVRISGAPGVCVGRIENIRTPDEMPDRPGFDTAGEFAPRQIAIDWGVSRVALISFHPNPEQEAVFVAFEIAGEWYDLKRQPLTLEVIGQYSN